jgi:hypothetical protein
MHAAKQAFDLVLYSKLLFFERCNPDLIPIGTSHFGADRVFEFLVLIGQMIDMPLQCHACTSFFQTREFKHQERRASPVGGASFLPDGGEVNG